MESYEYDAYGQTVETASVDTNNPYAYTGRELDDDELYYYRARYYDPSTQRFLSEDPIGYNSGDYNWYRYVWNSPAQYIDAMGLTAYNCKVPLHSLPGTWGLPGMYHQYSCVKINGKMTCGGMDRTGSALWSPGKPSIDEYVPGKCRRRSGNSCFEQCLLDEWAKPRPQYGIGPQAYPGDCQEYDDNVNDTCWEKCQNAK